MLMIILTKVIEEKILFFLFNFFSYIYYLKYKLELFCNYKNKKVKNVNKGNSIFRRSFKKNNIR